MMSIMPDYVAHVLLAIFAVSGFVLLAIVIAVSYLDKKHMMVKCPACKSRNITTVADGTEVCETCGHRFKI
jgi:transposase-like protein